MEPRSRASPEQFSVLIDYMERHGDLSRPQPGPQGRIKSDRLWQKLTDILNSLGCGVKKSSDKWKKVWADWKTKTKKKYLSLRIQASSTGGGPSSRITLTALEERVVAVIGESAVVGQVGIREQGFNRTPSDPLLEAESAIDIVPEENSENIAVVTSASPAISWLSTPVQATHISPRVIVATAASATPASPPSSHSQPPPPPPSPPPRTPPTRNNRRRQVSASPRSTATTPRRLLLRPRRNRGLTPFERAADQFSAIEQHRLQHEEARDKHLHEREIERLRLEAERIEVAREHNSLLHQLSLLGQRLLDVITEQRPVGSLPSTDHL